jgi:hypothetical protein
MTSPFAPIFKSHNTRKTKRDYAALNKHGLFGGDIPLTPPQKKGDPLLPKIKTLYAGSLNSYYIWLLLAYMELICYT